jgi:primary-amine oxidase
MYERDGGSLWDRLDPATLERDARFARELVVTASMVIGNYTYMVDYVFRLDGSIDVRAGATGTTLNRGIAVNGTDERFGGTVSPNISAPNHQHFFNFRIDFDVDGPSNRLVEGEYSRACRAPYGNAFSRPRPPSRPKGSRDINPTTTGIGPSSTTAKRARQAAHCGSAGRGRPRLRRQLVRAAEAAPYAQHACGVHAVQGR